MDMDTTIKRAISPAGEDQTRGRPRSAEKNKAMLDAATTLFLEKGFDGTSMDAVAQTAGVSKQTVYSHFSSKETLFSAAVQARARHVFPNQILGRANAPTVEAALRAIANDIARISLSEQAIAIIQVITSAGENRKRLADLFWESGPVEIQDQMAALIDGWCRQGALDVDDSVRAASDFLALLRGDLQFRLVLGLITDVQESQIKAHIDHCITLFMRMYGVK